MVNSLASQTPKPWGWFLLRRAGAHLIVGAGATAFVGAFCIGALGAGCGYVLDLGSLPASWDDGFTLVGASLGASLGAWAGVVGALVCGRAGVVAPASRHILPPRALLQPVVLGQIAGTLVAGATFFLWEVLQAQNTGLSFGRTVEQDLHLIVWGAPALMLCGAVAGALVRAGGKAGHED